MKILVFCVFVILAGCNSYKETLVLEPVTIHNFYGMRQDYPDMPINESYDKVFPAMSGLQPISELKSDFELRILFGSLQYDRLAVISIENDHAKIIIYNRKLEDIGDSFYINLDEKLTISDKTIAGGAETFIKQVDRSIASISSVTESINQPGVLDGGESFYVQLKSGSQLKSFFIYDPALHAEQGSASAKELIMLLNLLITRCKINFWQPWYLQLEQFNMSLVSIS